MKRMLRAEVRNKLPFPGEQMNFLNGEDPSPKLVSRVEVITPILAAQYLLLNHVCNRKIHNSVVKSISMQMQKGEWSTTHQGIAFDTDGRLIDGQHRLSAVVDSGVTIEMMVTRGLKDASCIDIGARRTVNDLIAMKGERRTLVYTSILHGMFAFTPKNRQGITPLRWIELEQIHRVSLMYMEEIYNSHRGKRVFLGSSLGPGVRALYRYPSTNVAKFYEILATGIISSTQQMAPAALRTWLTSNTNLAKEQVYRKTETALEAFLAGRQLTKIYMASKELFPLNVGEDV
jgi:hypothetical protein